MTAKAGVLLTVAFLASSYSILHKSSLSHGNELSIFFSLLKL